MDALWQDIRFALRALRKSPTVTLLAIVSLALAVGGNTAVFSLINGMLYRPLPYAEAERLAMVGESEKGNPTTFLTTASAPNLLDWRERQTSFAELAALRQWTARWSAGGDLPEAVGGAEVTPGFFATLGVEPLSGRGFRTDDGAPGAPPVVILGHDFWSGRLGSDPARLGAVLDLDGEPHTVVGILPEEFDFLDPSIEIWRPLDLSPAALEARTPAGTDPRRNRDLMVVGRLAEAATTESARAELTALAARLASEYPEANRGYTVSVLNLRQEIPDARNRQLFALLQGALVFVLLIACANIANLLLARGQRRRREMALRASLGASGGRLMRQLLTESLVTALAGGLLGLFIGWIGTRVLHAAMAASLPRFWLPQMDGRVLLFTLAVTAASGLVFGLMPALQGRRTDLAGALKEGGGRGAGGGRRRLATSALVVAEVGLALVLLAGTGVLLRSLAALRHQDPGFETAGLLTVNLDLPDESYPQAADLARAPAELAERLAALPGVVAATAAGVNPREPITPDDTYEVEGEPPAADLAPPRADLMTTGPGYFDTLGIGLERGRLLAAGDGPEAAPVAVINRRLAERHWPGGDAVGRSLTVMGTPRRVVGVVADVRHAMFLGEEPRPTVYLPLAQAPERSIRLLLRSAGDPAAMAEPARRALAEIDPRLATATAQPLEDYVGQFFTGARVFSGLLGGFGSLALLLAAVGIYGVLAYAVAERRHEIGVRMALGARRHQVVGMVLRQGLTLAVLGLAVGVPGVWLITRAVAAALSGFVAVEPATVLFIAAVLAAVTATASLLPASRAAGVDPLVALRGD